MKRLFFLLSLSVLSVQSVVNSPAASVTTAVLTVTNTPVTSNVFYFAASSSSLRTWTNQTTANTILTNLTSKNASATNLFTALANYPLLGITVSMTNTNTLVLKAVNLVVTNSGTWLTITLTTNTGTNIYSFVGPNDNLPPASRTNQNSEMIYGLGKYSTNAIPTNSPSLSNHLSLGVGPGGAEQLVSARKTFAGGLGAANVGLTNGYTKSVTNINPVTSNLVNYGNAIRSEGTGGNSFQAGSNAVAAGARSTALGNEALATNTDSIAVGSAAMALSDLALAIGTDSYASNSGAAAIGNQAFAIGVDPTAVGAGAGATADAAIALGSSAFGAGGASIALGFSAQADDQESIALGYQAHASKQFAIAIGSAAQGIHSNSMALGPRDSAGNAATTTTTNQLRLGTGIQTLSVPGLITGPNSTNANFAGTNTWRGDIAYPSFSVTTLANGNNISVPFGTNVFIRLAAGGLTTFPTICGIIGGATSGGRDGQQFVVFNDTGTNVVFAMNTVDPVPANRIENVTGADLTIINQGWIYLRWSGQNSRWKVTSTYTGTNQIATATNVSLPQLTDVVDVFTGLANRDFLVYNSSAGLWTNSPITWQTAGVTIATSPLTLNFTTGLTGSVSASTMTVGIAAPAAPVVSQIYPLMVQSAWRPSTNMPTLEAGYQGWELQFHRTNAAGANVNLYSHWHFTTPTNYVTNSLQLRLWSTILSTNGPNNSNVIWRAQILRGGATGTNDIRVGAFASSESVTQTWTQTYFGTNLAQTAVITCTNGNIGAGDFGILKLTRDNVNDTYTGSSSLVGAQLEFRTQ